MQNALTSQLCVPWVHSFSSEHVNPLPTQPEGKEKVTWTSLGELLPIHGRKNLCRRYYTCITSARVGPWWCVGALSVDVTVVRALGALVIVSTCEPVSTET